MNILVTGGTGFVGTMLVKNLIKEKHHVTILTRIKKINDVKVEYVNSLNDIDSNYSIDIIINLAGANISRRWTKSYKKILINSRIKTTEKLLSLVKRLNSKPKLFINASAVGYYGNRADNTAEDAVIISNDFAHKLCERWESLANIAKDLGVNVCVLRLGVVLGRSGGALAKMLPVFNLGLGGTLGTGKQFFSWVHIDDVVRAILFIIKNNIDGVFNVTSPNPVTNNYFTKALGKILNRPTIFNIPSLFIKVIFGEMGESLLLQGNRVLPEKIIKLGFKFNYDNINKALEDIIKN